MKPPPVWSDEEFKRQVDIATGLFRERRIGEPRTQWQRTFRRFSGVYARLIETYGVADPTRLSAEALSEVFRDSDLATAFRHLAGPPISADDLKVLAETTLAPGKLAMDTAASHRVVRIMLEAIDPIRFPWVVGSRTPTKPELDAAILASAALVTAQRVATKRRNTSKAEQELKLRTYLSSRGWKEVPARAVQTFDDAPGRGQFCGESTVGSRKADVCVRLHDGRLMPIECKVSNSALNSIKRVKNDAAAKADQWLYEFGKNQIVPAALLSGVFKTRHLHEAQERGLVIFWAHDLDALGKFLQAARSASRRS